jgi:enoyl-CoA hydratase/3-hydroxyacyl-CoA dehydrogenase
MEAEKVLYSKFSNPFLLTPKRPLPDEFAVVGAGTIGPDIAYYLKSAMAGKKLYLVDVVPEPLKRAEKRFADYAQKAVGMKKMTEEQAQAVLGNITYTTDYAAISRCGLVIEAATENLALKQKIFQAIEDNVGDDAIITSNTSSIPANRIFSSLRRPERSTVTHFFAPAWRSPAVEVVKWDGVAPEILDYLFWFFAKTGKTPVITDNVISFMLNRIFENWCNDAAHLLDSGATAADIDAVAEEFVGGGPFFVLNMGNGNPLVHEANTRKMEEGDCYRPAAIFRSVEKWAVPKPGTKRSVPEDVKQQVRDRLLGILFSQSFDIVDRGIGTPGDLNYGCQVGLGFKKGPLDVMRDLGAAEVERIAKRFDMERPGFPRPKQPIEAYQSFNRHLLVDDIEGVKVITIRRPQAMNAVGEEVNNEILGVLRQYADDPAVRGFILTGYGEKAFSAGADIGKFPETLGNMDAAVRLAADASTLMAYMDRMTKPVVAAVNGMALGGGLEVAIRCHSLVAVRSAFFQFPEITLGILPGTGGCVVPYRRWPAGASTFHEMICHARKLTATEAAEIGMVSKVVDDFPSLIRAAIEEVRKHEGKTTAIPEGPVAIPEIVPADAPKAGPLPLSREAISIIADTVKAAAAAPTLEEALRANYLGAGRISCAESSKEGISAFLQKRKPEFAK